MKSIIIKVLAISVIAICYSCVGSSSENKYKTRKEELNATKTKTTIEVVLPQKEPIEKLEEISRYYREKHKTENVLISFYLTDTQKKNYAYSGWSGDKFDGINILQPVYGNLDWFINSLQIPNTEIIGIWGDTLEIHYIVGIISQGENIILKSASLKSKSIYKDEYLQLERNNKMDVYRSKKHPDENESYSIHPENNELAVYGRFYNINNEITGGELGDVLPPVEYEKAAK